MEQELWKDISSFEGLYQISNLGRVKSLEKKRGRNLGVIIPEIIMKLSLSKRGYPRVQLQKNKFKKTIEVHKLVAGAFIENKYNKPQINHIDGNKKNNHVNNLEWCTNNENQKHAQKIGINNAGVRNGNTKLSEVDVVTIRQLFPKLRKFEIARLYDVKQSTVHAIIKRYNWKHI